MGGLSDIVLFANSILSNDQHGNSCEVGRKAWAQSILQISHIYLYLYVMHVIHTHYYYYYCIARLIMFNSMTMSHNYTFLSQFRVCESVHAIPNCHSNFKDLVWYNELNVKLHPSEWYALCSVCVFQKSTSMPVCWGSILIRSRTCCGSRGKVSMLHYHSTGNHGEKIRW